MSKDIDIEYVMVKCPKVIKVDGVVYPTNQRNLDIVAEYNKTGDESVLDRLINFSIVF